MQFPNPISTQVVVFDGATNTPVVNIGPGPNIIITQPGTNPPSTLKLTTSGTNLFSPEIIWSFFGAQKLRIRTGSGITPTPVFMEYLFNSVVTAAITMSLSECTIHISDQLGADLNGIHAFDTFTRVDRPVVASQVLDGNSGANEAWHGFAYAAGWSDRGGGYDSAQYRVMPDGTVRLRGSAKGGTTVDFTQLATLPVGYRPTNSKEFLSKSTVANSSIIINSAGGIFCLGMGAATNLVFDGMTFELPII